MQVDVLIRIAGVGLMVTVISQVLTRAGREDIATLASVAGILLVLVMVVSMAGDLLDKVQAAFLLPCRISSGWRALRCWRRSLPSHCARPIVRQAWPLPWQQA